MKAPPVVVVDPAELAVTLSEVKAQLRIDDASQDSLITSYIKAATRMAEHETGLRFVTQTLAVTYDAFVARVDLGVAPVQSVSSVTYADADGVSQTLSSGAYVLDTSGTMGAGAIVAAYGTEWPDTYDMPGVVRVEYVAGFGSDATTTPDPARAWIMLCVSQLYAGCGDISAMRWHPLLDDLRIYR